MLTPLLSRRRERAGVLEACAVIVTLIGLWGAAASTRRPSAPPWQLDVAKLTPAGAQMVREANAAFAEIERAIDGDGPPSLEATPTPAALSADLVAPFFSVAGPVAPMAFSLVRTADVTWYVGRAQAPTSPIGGIVLTLGRIEPSGTASVIDGTHHRLLGGETIHVGLWVLASGHRLPADATVDAMGVSHQPAGFLPSSPLLWGLQQVVPDLTGGSS